MNPFCAPVVDIVNYLSERIGKGDSYRTLNSRRSAISAFHIQVDGMKVGQHALIRRLLTASFNAKPTQPGYTVQWDVNIVNVNRIWDLIVSLLILLLCTRSY